MNRRSFLASILAAGVAPAIVKAGMLMPVRKLCVPSTIRSGILGPWGDFEIISERYDGPIIKYPDAIFAGFNTKPMILTIPAKPLVWPTL